MFENRLDNCLYNDFNYEYNRGDRRLNVYNKIIIKDIQIIVDPSGTSSFIEHVAIPLSNEDFILITDLFDKLQYDYNISMRSAQWIYIWDPEENVYLDITYQRQIHADNFKKAPYICFRYLPWQEPALPPHSTMQSMIEDTKYEYPITNNSTTSQHINNTQLYGHHPSNSIHGNQLYYQHAPLSQNLQYYSQTMNSTENQHFATSMHQEGAYMAMNQKIEENCESEDFTKSKKGSKNLSKGQCKLEDLQVNSTQSVTYKNKSEDSLSEPELKGKSLSLSSKPKDFDFNLQKDASCNAADSTSKNHKQLPREKRVKERQISYVKSKVDEWRNLYDHGFTNNKGENEKVNLDVAASLVGLSRKTLDDYYAQLRKAQKYGFDFETNKSQKMGILRKYVKKMSEKDTNANDDDSMEIEQSQAKKITFKTPQLKPSIPSDLLKQELSLSVGDSQSKSTKSMVQIQNSQLSKQQPLFYSPQIKIEHNNQQQEVLSLNNFKVEAQNLNDEEENNQNQMEEESFGNYIQTENTFNKISTKEEYYQRDSLNNIDQLN